MARRDPSAGFAERTASDTWIVWSTTAAPDRRLNCRIGAATGEVFLFGAHIFAQYLIEFGLDKDSPARERDIVTQPRTSGAAN